MALSDLTIRNAKPGDRQRKLSDEKGLYLVVTPSGSKIWRWDFRFNGKRLTKTYGKWPALSLAAARTQRQRDGDVLARGIDPRLGNPLASEGGDTFKAVAERWLESRSETWSERYSEIVRNLIERDLYPSLGSRAIGEIEPPELLDVLRRVEGRGVRETAHRVRAYAGKIFRLAIAEGLATRDPSFDIRDALKPKPKVRNMARLDEKELPDLLLKLDSEPLEPVTRDALLLAMLTVGRTGEVRFAAAEEFEDLDGNEPLWRISAERMKMDRPHLVPLSRQAVEVVKRRLAAIRSGSLLFASDTRHGVISENTMLYALYRMGFHRRATVHGFRGSFSTIANEHEWNSDHIELCLAHVQGGVRGAYNAARYLQQRRVLLQWWADYLDGLKAGRRTRLPREGR